MITQQSIRPMCRVCNQLPARPNGKTILGFTRWHTKCNRCIKKNKKILKKDSCDECNFVCKDSCQLCYVDEKTICQNCNALRLKNIKKKVTLTVDSTVDW